MTKIEKVLISFEKGTIFSATDTPKNRSITGNANVFFLCVCMNSLKYFKWGFMSYEWVEKSCLTQSTASNDLKIINSENLESLFTLGLVT